MPVADNISVVIPAYNAESTITRTLQSALNQTLLPKEIIVVDDGSKDSTADVVRQFAPQVRLIQQKNSGPSAARNHGIRESSGEWIALLDSDDAWLPNKIERQAALIADDVALIHTFIKDDPYHPEFEMTFEALWRRNDIGTSTVLVNKELLIRVGGFPEDRSFIGAEDYNLWLRLAKTGKRIVTIREPLSEYTPIEGSLSSQIAKVLPAELLNVDKIAQQFNLPQEMVSWKKNALYEEYAKALFWIRNMPMAREYYLKLLKNQPSPSAAVHYLATFLPRWLLDIRRTPSAQPEPAQSVVSLRSASNSNAM